MKRILVATTLVVAAILGFSTSANAQQDHWSTVDQCIAAQGAPYYYPTIVHRQAPANDEVAQGQTTPLCIDMTLPDRFGGRGWVRVGDDRKIIYSKTTGKPLRLAECNNRIYAIIALPAIQAMDGKDGAPGRDGTPGAPGPQGPQGVPGRDGQDGYVGRDANCDYTAANYPPKYGYYPQQAADGYGYNGYPQEGPSFNFQVPMPPIPGFGYDGGYGNQAYGGYGGNQGYTGSNYRTGGGRGNHQQRDYHQQRQQHRPQQYQRNRQPQHGGNGGYRTSPQHSGGGGGRPTSRPAGVGPGARTGGYR